MSYSSLKGTLRYKPAAGTKYTNADQTDTQPLLPHLTNLSYPCLSPQEGDLQE
ncbi:hypothetical protein AB6D86_12220 [Vibrio splendidus]